MTHQWDIAFKVKRGEKCCKDVTLWEDLTGSYVVIILNPEDVLPREKKKWSNKARGRWGQKLRLWWSTWRSHNLETADLINRCPQLVIYSSSDLCWKFFRYFQLKARDVRGKHVCVRACTSTVDVQHLNNNVDRSFSTRNWQEAEKALVWSIPVGEV